MTGLLHSRSAGRDKNVVVVETLVSLVGAETEIQVDVVEVRDESDKERRVSCSSRVDPMKEKLLSSGPGFDEISISLS